MIERSRIVDIISQAIRDVQVETGMKVDLSRAILLIDQGILDDSQVLSEIIGLKVFSAGHISHTSEAMLAFPDETTSDEERFMYKFIGALQSLESMTS